LRLGLAVCFAIGLAWAGENSQVSAQEADSLLRMEQGEGAAPVGEPVAAITLPSSDVTMSFLRPGRVEKLAVKEGDRVEQGAELARLDDAPEQLQLAQLKFEAETDIRIKAAEAQLAQRRKDLDKTQKAFESRAATQLEVEQAQLEVTIADLSLALSRFEQAQAQRKYEEAKAQLSRMVLRSSVAGLVEKLYVERGESVDALAEVVRVVKVDPLRLEVAAPLSLLGAGLDENWTARIEFPDGSTAAGKIVFVGATAESASQTLTVKVEVANPAGRPAGEQVDVRFAAAVAAAEAQQLAAEDAGEPQKENE
jgi:RND family efflux transporter MFP subunit